MDQVKKTEIRKYMILLCIVSLVVCIVNYRYWIRSYNTTMLALSYDYGFTSRSLLGTIYHVFNNILPIDMMQYNAALIFATIFTGLLFIFFMFFVYRCLLRFEGKKLKYAEYMLMLLSICSVATFSYAYNFFRVDIFMLACSLAGVLVLFSDKFDWFAIVFAALGVMFHQGYVLMYFNIILVVIIYKLLTYEKRRIKYALLLVSTFLTGSFLFIWFELLSKGKGVEIFDTVLNDATNLSLNGIYHSTLLYHEVLGIDVSGAETSFYLMNHVQILLFVICCLPAIIYLIRFFIKIISKGKGAVNKLKYIAMLVGVLTIMPDMLFKVDYGRWVMSIVVYYIVVIVAIGALGDEIVQGQMEEDYMMLKGKPWMVFVCLAPIVLVPFMDVDIDMLSMNWQRWFQNNGYIFY